jgi:hypothetical protein
MVRATKQAPRTSASLGDSHNISHSDATVVYIENMASKSCLE